MTAWVRWLALSVTLVLIRCAPYEEPLSNRFGFIDYNLVAYRDSLRIRVSNPSSLVLNYRIRGVTGKLTNSFVFLMPLTDTVTITWYNGLGDSLVVPFRMNRAVFDSLPLANDSIGKVIHPDDTQVDYTVDVIWSNAPYLNQPAWDYCLDSTGAAWWMKDTLSRSQSNTFTAPEGKCRLGLVSLNSITADTINYGIVTRGYGIEFQFKLGGKCGAGFPCIVLQ